MASFGGAGELCSIGVPGSVVHLRPPVVVANVYAHRLAPKIVKEVCMLQAMPRVQVETADIKLLIICSPGLQLYKHKNRSEQTLSAQKVTDLDKAEMPWPS